MSGGRSHETAAPRVPADLLAAATRAWFDLEVEPVVAATEARRLVDEADAAGDVRAAAYARSVVAWQLGAAGEDVATALAELARIEAALAVLGDDGLRPRYHCAAAMVHGAMGDRATRFEHLEKMRAVSVAGGDVYHELVALHDMVVVFGRHELLDEALVRAEVIGEPASLVVALRVRAAEHLVTAGRAVEAEAAARRALALADEHGVRAARSSAAGALARALGAQHRSAEALVALDQMDAWAIDLGPAERLLVRARTHASVGRDDEAVAAYEGALAAGRAPVSYRTALAAAAELAPLLARRRSWQRAYEVQVRYEELRGRIDDEETSRRLRALEVQHRMALARQQVAQEQARNRDLAEHVALLERLNREVSELASRDALTGLFNRRRADQELDRLLASAAIDGVPASVALVDVDRFKSVNDRFGHAVGDRVLCELAAVIAHHLRSGDTAARFGGEEFVVLLPATGIDEARLVCERLRAVIEAHPWAEALDGRHVTVSIGITEADPHRPPGEVLAAADARLYEAKRDGRNRVRG